MKRTTYQTVRISRFEFTPALLKYRSIDIRSSKCFTFSGSCVQSVNGIQIPMKEGDICILDTNVYHSLESVGSNDIIIDCLMRKSYFDNTFMSQLADNTLMSSFFVHAIHQDKSTISISCFTHRKAEFCAR